MIFKLPIDVEYSRVVVVAVGVDASAIVVVTPITSSLTHSLTHSPQMSATQISRQSKGFGQARTQAYLKLEISLETWRGEYAIERLCVCDCNLYVLETTTITTTITTRG